MSKTINIAWPKPESRFPQGIGEYVDVHGLIEPCMKLLAPQEWVEGLDDAPPSSNILFNSTHGLGKSLLAATLCLELAKVTNQKVPLVTFDCDRDTRNYHMIGKSEIQDNETFFVPGPLPEAIWLANECGACVLVIEEISALMPGAQKKLNPMTDWRRGMYVPQMGGNIVQTGHSRVIIIATMNPSSYQGGNEVNEDLRSRFDEFVLPAPTDEQERRILNRICPFADNSHVERAAQLAMETRNEAVEYTISTRDLVKFLENIHKLGGKIEIPLELVANKFESSDRDIIAKKIKQIFSVQVSVPALPKNRS